MSHKPWDGSGQVEQVGRADPLHGGQHGGAAGDQCPVRAAAICTVLALWMPARPAGRRGRGAARCAAAGTSRRWIYHDQAGDQGAVAVLGPAQPPTTCWSLDRMDLLLPSACSAGPGLVAVGR